MKIPRPTDRVYRIKRDALTFWTPANSKHHAKRMIQSLAADMQHSVALRQAWEIVKGHVGIGHAGVAMAKRKGRK